MRELVRGRVSVVDSMEAFRSIGLVEGLQDSSSRSCSNRCLTLTRETGREMGVAARELIRDEVGEEGSRGLCAIWDELESGRGRKVFGLEEEEVVTRSARS